MIGGRTLVQVLGIYAAGSWLVLQVVDVLVDNMGLPDWVFPFAVVLLLIGLPIILTTAVVQKRLSGGTAGADAGPESDGSTELSDEPAAGVTTAGSAAGATSEIRRLFTWRNALLGGGLAFVMLATVTGGFMYMRNSGVGPVGSLVAKGVLEERAPLILTEFESREPGLAATATEALRIDLSQSDVVKVVEPAVIGRVLDRMEIELEGPLDEETAREIAIREGWPAVIVGEINEAGGRYVLSARLVDAQNGSELLALRETASNESEIVPAVDELSARFRERVGESYGSLRASVPLEQVTTGSLDALRLYSQALEADDSGDDDRAIALLEEAVERDTAFAMAWRKLGVLLSNRNVEGGRALEAEKKAFAHRDRLTTRERYLTEGTYYNDVVKDRGRAINAYENLLDLNPDDAWALNNLGVLAGAQGDHARALELYQRSFAADPSNVLALGNQSVMLKKLGRTEEARAVLEEALRITPEAPDMLNRLANLEMGEGNFERAAALYDSVAALGSGSGYWNWIAQEGGVLLADARGRISEGERERAQASRFLVEQGWGGTYLWRASWSAWTRLLAARDPEGAARILDEALDRYPPETIPDGEAPLLNLAMISAALGRMEVAEAFLERHSTADAAFAGNGWDVTLEKVARAQVAEQAGDVAAALELYESLERSNCPECGPFYKGFLLEAEGDRAGAIAAWELYVSQGWHIRHILDAMGLGTVLESLGRMHEAEGDPEKAAIYYAQFVELWADADPELQPRVKAAQARLEEIVRERG
ncbi:MAG: tetratricopeptide repeat protein [marine benthic group bacterium]|nr:tetratricopeptide repeat protein [Gemmatimonadota bacterium]MCL7984785.1 tetratricopeptide repeat protein [Gemmatimonadota bacterium]